MKISVVIVNYNVSHFLEQALSSVRVALRGIESEVWVVDNNSVDNSVSMVRERFPEVNLIANTKNVGFSTANNQAIRLSKGEFVLLLNPDTVVREDTFQVCLNFMATHPDAGALGVRMIDGRGNFLPESKRGFPSPMVAFYKTFGLSRLFKKSRIFNQYHLGYLSEHENHQVEVLSGAFMFIRNTALQKIGLLDETFFMYGEDIDLSYRIIQGGFNNYYVADTSILHYKGESTKRGSLNYVKTFYQAMIIFVRKHFTGKGADLFVFMLQAAVWFRAFITILGNFFETYSLIIAETLLLILGFTIGKNFWASYRFDQSDAFPNHVVLINSAIYVASWLMAIGFRGAYHSYRQIGKMLEGLALGTLIIAAVYGFLPTEYRFSRMVILLSMALNAALLTAFRLSIQFLKYKNFNLSAEQRINIAIIGSVEETLRVNELLLNANVNFKNIYFLTPNNNEAENRHFTGRLRDIAEICNIYQINELIFCSKDVSSETIIELMLELGNAYIYKIVPLDSLSIIGSNSKNTAGDLYTLNIHFNLQTDSIRRSKRLFDLISAIIGLILLPYLVFKVKSPLQLIGNLFGILVAQKTWVSYKHEPHSPKYPPLRPGVLKPNMILMPEQITQELTEHCNLEYAKNYNWHKDLYILLKNIHNLDLKQTN
jgi:GT2 family glycosyltransferase